MTRPGYPADRIDLVADQLRPAKPVAPEQLRTLARLVLSWLRQQRNHADQPAQLPPATTPPRDGDAGNTVPEMRRDQTATAAGPCPATSTT
jgi:hypothetical protein